MDTPNQTPPPTPVLLAHTTAHDLPVTVPDHQQVIPGRDPAHFDLRTRLVNGTYGWALSTPDGIRFGHATNLADLADSVSELVTTLIPDVRERGAAVHYQWPLPCLPMREPMAAYLAATHPHVRFLEPRTRPAARTLWALMGTMLRCSPTMSPPALPAPDEPSSPEKAAALVVATDASLGGLNAGWAYVTSEGEYATGSSRRQSRAAHQLSHTQRMVRVDKYELRAVRAAIAKYGPLAGQRDVLVLSDNKHAVTAARTWLAHHPQHQGLRVEWTPGHAGHVLNEAADRLSRLARIGQGAQDTATMAAIATEASVLWGQGRVRLPAA